MVGGKIAKLDEKSICRELNHTFDQSITQWAEEKLNKISNKKLDNYKVNFKQVCFNGSIIYMAKS